MKITVSIVMFVTLLGSFCVATGSERASGSFTASRACDGYSSFAKGNNPGTIKTKPGAEYVVSEVNKPGNYEWVRIDIPEASPTLRWVSRECGVAMLDTAPGPERGGAAMCSTPNKQDSYVLAMSWQAGFCEHGKHGKKPECDALGDGSLSVNNLTLHGLWPNRRQCGQNYGNCDGAPFALSEETVSHIAPWMPNFYYETSFGQYEWNKHGKCQSLDPDRYFKKAVAALKIVNASLVGETVLRNTGRAFASADFFQALKAKYGDKVARNVMLICSGQDYLQEIRVNLPLNFSTEQGMAELVGDAVGFGSRTSGCGAQIRVEANGTRQ